LFIVKFKLTVKLTVVFVCILPEKAVPEMTYTVSGGTLNPTHSLTRLQMHFTNFGLPSRISWQRIKSFVCNVKKISRLEPFSRKHTAFTCQWSGSPWLRLTKSVS